ncbi:MAG TPA: hypothetical protein VGR95_16035 [Thermoanaerobaculia bacterium]|nr:hypothetical protein [Thermoanaerobaculia bacterium]
MTENGSSSRKKMLMTILLVVIVLIGFGVWFTWFKFFRVVPEPEWQAKNGHSAGDMRFMYGSVGAENGAGMPYWIAYVLPRVFPDLLPGREGKPPGSGGYAALGANWEQGEELPIGFTKKTIGFVRVANNCAACHTARIRTRPDQNPRFVPTGPNHTFNLQAYFRFVELCAKDPRFNSGRLMEEINQSADLSWVDQLIYRFILIPATRRQILALEGRFDWVFQHGDYWPEWGRGRDDAMNLTKYFLTGSKMDDTLGPTDMPSIWNLRKYDDNIPLHRLNFAGDSYDANSVIIDSALGLIRTAPPSNAAFLNEVGWLHQYLGGYPPPKYRDFYPANTPGAIDDVKAARGRMVFVANCAQCHENAKVTGTVVPRAGVFMPNQPPLNTDVQRILSWNREAAIKANSAVSHFGIYRHGLVEENPYGYVAAFLDGIWLRAPYLHNGSVGSLREMLKPAAQRTPHFWRGFDVYDPADAGFVSTPEQAKRLGVDWDDVLQVATPYDVRLRSCGNGGHEYGVTLSDADKDALIEYLKTL